MSAPKILAFAGSLRRDSWNKKLVGLAAELARQAGAEVTLIDLRDFPLPLMDEDLEAAEGMPAKAQELKRLFLSHQGLLIASPEYNSSVTAVLKNAIDWVSRKSAGDLQAWPFAGKVAGLLAASTGSLGGLRGLVHLRAILGNIDVLVLPEQVAVMRAHDAFTPEGQLKDGKTTDLVRGLTTRLVDTVRRLQAR